MKYNPHDYQIYAINFIKEHPIAAILLDMGMGKTSIVLAALNDLMFDSFEIRKVLVIAPLRVARDTWTAETDKWDHLQDLICSVAVGTEAQRRAAITKALLALKADELVVAPSDILKVKAAVRETDTSDPEKILKNSF